MGKWITSLVGVCMVMLGGCAEPALDRARSTAGSGPDCCSGSTPAARQVAVAQTAARLIGARTIEIQGRRIAYDCAGVTRAIYLAHGIDLYDSPGPDPQANGVRLIYHHVRRHGHLHGGPAAQPGDLVFFDNTWDYNADGRVNDPLTHVGVVERMEADGTVVFVSRVAEAVERYRMNLATPHLHRTPDGRIVNDYMRRKHATDAAHTHYLTGELFTAFGTRIVR